jgi:(2Fe-2S) ferredoxin
MPLFRAHELLDTLQDELVAQDLINEIQVLETSRIGSCADEPEMMVYPAGAHYIGLSENEVPYLVEEHFLKGQPKCAVP